MKAIITAFFSLLIITSTQAQDSCITKVTTFYVDSVLPHLRPMMLTAKEELRAADSRPDAPSHNLDLADVCASLLQFDSAMYFIQQELAIRDITKSLRNYKMLFLLMRDPVMYKRFTDSVFFGRYNIDNPTGRKRYIPSEFCMQYIENELLITPAYNQWESHFSYKTIKMTWEEGQLLKNRLEQVAIYMRPHLEKIDLVKYVNKIQLPQYSKDGIVPVTKVINNMSSLSWLLRDLVANKTTEITALLEKRELPDGICYSVDNHLLEQGKPQRYGTHIKKEKEKTVLQSPHDSMKEIAARRKLAGLNTVQEMIDEEEKSFKRIQVMPN